MDSASDPKVTASVNLGLSGAVPPLDGRRVAITGRVAVEWTMTAIPRPYIAVTACASRFHPASVAGLVVGAMGMFVFGIYLRGYLRERRAAPATEHTEVTENDA